MEHGHLGGDVFPSPPCLPYVWFPGPVLWTLSNSHSGQRDLFRQQSDLPSQPYNRANHDTAFTNVTPGDLGVDSNH